MCDTHFVKYLPIDQSYNKLAIYLDKIDKCTLEIICCRGTIKTADTHDFVG